MGEAIQISARNILPGQITRIAEGTINDEIEVTMADGNQIIAVAAKESVASLNLKQGKAVYAMFKAPWVILARRDKAIHSSARNQLDGTIIDVMHSAVNAEVAVELSADTVIYAVVPNDSVKSLNLVQGTKVTALIMANHVLLGLTKE